MKNKHKLIPMPRTIKRIGFGFTSAIIAIALLLPILSSRSAEAAGQILSRSLSISSGIPSKTGVEYKLTFTPSSTSDLEGIKLQACTTAVGNCTAPTGLSFSSRTFVSQNGWQGGTNFAVDTTGANDCTPSASIICANRTDATAQTTTSRDITFGTITNPSTVNSTFFVRISLYNASTYPTGAGFVDYGVTASAVVQTLTTSAAVAEVLNFCVGATTANAGTGTSVIPSDCSGVTGTSVNIGVLSTGGVNISPVTTTNGGDNNNGLVMLRTNSTNGTSVSYHAVQAASGTNHLGALRITGATCDATDPSTSTTDGCINSAGWNGTVPTQTTLTNGTELFGMTIAGVNCESTTSYSCTFAGGTYNLVRNTDYDGDGTNNATNFTDTDVVAGTTTNGYAWDESTSVFDTIAASTTYVDDEALLLKFAATSSLITPFGSYTVQSDFVAVTTY